MHNFTFTQASSAEPVPASPAEQAALEITRAAIARWSGNPNAPAPHAHDHVRVSPQARWVAEAQYGLASWIAHGGFAQIDDTGTATEHAPLVMFQVSERRCGVKDCSGACID